MAFVILNYTQWNENAPCPLLLGHEGTGIVTKVGRRVSHLKEGDHAIVTWVPRIPYDGPQFQRPTGVSYLGNPINGNQYTWAEDVLVDSTFVVGIPAEYATAASCIVGCAVLTGAGAVLHTAKVRPGESVAVSAYAQYAWRQSWKLTPLLRWILRKTNSN